ncbi:MAG: hypothetical protein H6523_12985 [Mycolicibacterium sp.]|nr:hypothetical protein [Mycolicibacterium sp.]
MIYYAQRTDFGGDAYGTSIGQTEEWRDMHAARGPVVKIDVPQHVVDSGWEATVHYCHEHLANG